MLNIGKNATSAIATKPRTAENKKPFMKSRPLLLLIIPMKRGRTLCLLRYEIDAAGSHICSGYNDPKLFSYGQGQT